MILAVKILLVVWTLLLIIRKLSKNYIENNILEAISFKYGEGVTVPGLIYVLSTLLLYLIGFIIVVLIIFII